MSLRKRMKNRKDLWPLVFSLVIFALIDDLPSNAVLRIDEEYTGKNRVIAATLTKLLTDRFPEGWRGSIRFGRIGKYSAAHRLAWRIHRSRNKQKVRTLTEEQILKLTR